MTDKHTADVSSPRLFALHHLTSLVLLMLGLGLFVFVVMAGEILEGRTMQFDRWLLMELRTPGDPGDPIGPLWVEEMFRDFTALGGVGVLGLLTLLSVMYLWLLGLQRTALFTLLAILGGLLLSTLLKTGFDRPRPDIVTHGSLVYTSSFPSGHSMLSAVVYLTGAALLATVHKTRSLRIYLIGMGRYLPAVSPLASGAKLKLCIEDGRPQYHLAACNESD